MRDATVKCLEELIPAHRFVATLPRDLKREGKLARAKLAGDRECQGCVPSVCFICALLSLHAEVVFEDIDGRVPGASASKSSDG